MLLPKKNSYKEFDNEKNSCGSRIPLPPPITFLLVRSLLFFVYLETVLRVSAKVNWAQGMGKPSIYLRCHSLQTALFWMTHKDKPTPKKETKTNKSVQCLVLIPWPVSQYEFECVHIFIVIYGILTQSELPETQCVCFCLVSIKINQILLELSIWHLG